MPPLTPSARALHSSGIREILDLVVARGPDADIARLEIGEPGFRAAPHIVEAAQRAAAGDVTYTQSAGTLALRTEVARSLGRRYDLDVPTDRIIISQGGSQGIAAVFEALIGPGDEVLVPDPAWPNYEMMTRLRGATAVRYELCSANGFQPDPDEIAALITPATRILVLNTPSNPTGAVLPRALVERIVLDAAARGVIVVSDEVYDELIFDGGGRCPANAASIAPDSVVSVFSFSKTYAMTGWRVGYLVMPRWLAEAVGHIQETLLSCISTVSQAAAIAALTGPQEAVGAMREGYRERRDVVVEQLTAGGIPVTPPEGAFYLMVPLAGGVDARAAARDLVDWGVSFAPGTAFGRVAHDQLRMSLAGELPVLGAGVARFLRWHRATEGGLALAEAPRLATHIVEGANG